MKKLGLLTQEMSEKNPNAEFITLTGLIILQNVVV